MVAYGIAYSRAPINMRGLVSAINLFNTAIAYIVNLACSSAVVDPHLIWDFGGPTIVGAVVTVVFVSLNLAANPGFKLTIPGSGFFSNTSTGRSMFSLPPPRAKRFLTALVLPTLRPGAHTTRTVNCLPQLQRMSSTEYLRRCKEISSGLYNSVMNIY